MRYRDNNQVGWGITNFSRFSVLVRLPLSAKCGAGSDL